MIAWVGKLFPVGARGQTTGRIAGGGGFWRVLAGRGGLGGGGAGFAMGRVEGAVRAGFTLPEVMMVIAITAVLVAIGWYTAQDSIARNRMIRVARMLQSDIQLLRTMAITTNREARLKLVHADTDLDPGSAQQGEWLLQIGNRSDRSTEWDTLPIDEAGWDGAVAVVDDEGERSLAPGGTQQAPWISLAAWDPLAGPGLGNEDCVVFSPRGWVSNPPGDFRTGYIALRIVNKRAMLGGATVGDGEWVDLKLARGGLARMEFWNAAGALPTNAIGTAGATEVGP